MNLESLKDYVIEDGLDGKAVLVTGGSRGIGRAICFALAAKGVSVAIHYNKSRADAEDIQHIIEGAGGKAVIVQGDMGASNVPESLVQQTVDAFGTIDILVNNAGIMTDGLVENMTDEIWNETIQVNLTAAFQCARASIPYMKAKSWGRIINMTSQAANRGSSKHAHYAATKSGMLGLTYSLALELAAHNITVNMVSPGRIGTDMVLSRSGGRMEEWMSQTPMKRLGTSEEVASAVAFLASDAAAYITGSTLHVNGGLVMT